MLINRAMENQRTFHSCEPSKLSEKNQLLLLYHLYTRLKHTKQCCLLLTDLNIRGVKA